MARLHTNDGADTMDLEELRADIRKTDEQIFDLIAKRTKIAELIGAAKHECDLPIRNPAVEKKVIARYREGGESRGIGGDSMEAIAKILIQEAVDREASMPDPKMMRLEISIVGGAGKMGKWLGTLFSRQGHSVKVIDPASGSGLTLSSVSGSDIVIVSAPIDKTGDILKELDSLCREDALIFDIASLKTPHIGILRKMAEKRKVCSIHPMFGPSAKSLYGRNVIICNCGSGRAVEDSVKLFGNRGGNIRIMDIIDHDRYMSYVLGLSHAVNIAFFTVLDRSGISFADMQSAASTTFDKITDTNRSVALEDPELYYDIQHLNACRDGMWELFSEAVEDIKKASAAEDSKEFVKIMNAGKEYFSE